MDILIDTVASDLTFAIADQEHFYFETIKGKGSSERLPGRLQELYKSGTISSLSFSRVLYNRGPGSFTGIKVGFVTANALAYGNEDGLYSFTSFDLMESACEENTGVSFVINAFQGDFFLGRKIKKQWDFQVVKAEEIPTSEIVYYLGLEKYRKENWKKLPEPGEDALKRLFKEGLCSRENQPLYLKKSTAEIKRDMAGS
jgi:tRNA A37 threonylcarbamoyladenosine modification protein TsaB